MLNLVLTLIAIALFTVVLTYGFNYIDIEKTMGDNRVKIIKADIDKINFLVTKFKLEEEENPSDFSEMVSKGYMQSKIDNNGRTIFIPAINIDGIEWPQTNQLQFSGGALHICLGGNELSEWNFKTLKRLNSKNIRTLVAQEPDYSGYPEFEVVESDNENVILADQCFASADETIEPSENNTYRAWATFKIQGNSL